MKKEYISYAVVGIAVGLVLGFLVANFTYRPATGAQPSAAGANAGSASVNSGGPNSDLPPGHPPLDSAPTSAPPLPAESSADETASSASPSPSSSVELPSLDPLPAASKEERAEHKYKNIQLLKGLPSDRLMPIMFAFKSSLGVDCTYCHIKDQFEKDDKSTKQMARKMITLVRDANAKLASARVSCFTCHRGQPRPPQ
jgi:photosynthetic reaction center cytochrome c subunit